MAYDDEDDLFVDDFDFVDEDENDDSTKAGTQGQSSETGEARDEESKKTTPAKPKRRSSSRGGKRGSKQKTEPEAQDPEKTAEGKEAAPVEEEPKEPAVPTDHVVHIYEFGKFKRTISREFTNDDAEAFAVEYNRTSSAHSRQGVAAGRDDKPAEAL